MAIPPKKTHIGSIIRLILYGTLLMAKADVPKPRNITFETVLKRESLWWGTGSDVDWITVAVWFSVFPSAELWPSLWESSIAIFIKL